MMKPPPVVAADPEARVVVAGDVPLATIRPPPDVGVVWNDEAEAVKG
jgi:hypothetical protein